MKTKDMNLNELKYYVVPVERRGLCEYRDVHDRIFDFWDKKWTQAFNEAGNPKKGWQDHFTRMNLVSALEYQGQIIACLLFTFYDLTSKSANSSEYFSYINKSTVDSLVGDGFKDAMSVEYLRVDSEWSKNSLGTSLGKIIISLSAYVAENEGLDCIISMPISGTKVDQMLENIGSVTIQDKIEKYGYELKLVTTKTQPSQKGLDPKVRKITDTLWANRYDFSSSAKTLKEAA